jgi:hypothetical protein
MRMVRTQRVDAVDHVRQAHLKTGRAYAIKETLKAWWDQPPEAAEAFLRHCYFWVIHSRLDPIR